MSNTTEQLDKLHKLQEIQNAELFGNRLTLLEEQVNRLSQTINNIKLTVSQLKMEFHKDHTKLADVQLN